MAVGELKVNLTLDAEPFKVALAEVTAAVKELEAALGRLRASDIAITCSEPVLADDGHAL